MVLGIFLVISSIFDIWKKKVYVALAAITGLAGMIVQIVYQPLTWKMCIGGILIGSCLLIIAKVTKEAVGYGDGMVVIVIGIWLGLYQTVEILLLALTMAAILSALLLLLRKAGRKYAIPFVPFLLIAYLLIQLMD